MGARWFCKPCRCWGLGGPDGYLRHEKAEHKDARGAGSVVTLGFVGHEPRYGVRGRKQTWWA